MFGTKRLTNMIWKPAAREILLTTTTVLSRPYEELGMVTSLPGAIFQEDRERRLRKNTLKKYPHADAVIGIVMRNSMVMMGTAVRYTDSEPKE